MPLSCKGEPIGVLLVEDNPGDAVLFRKCLKGGGRVAELEVVYDGEDALDRILSRGAHAAKRTPDFVIMDLNIPKVGGLELLREVKSHEEMRRVPMIILTSSEDEEDVRGCYEAGANCVLIKATDFDGVANLVRKIEEFWIHTVCFAVPKRTEAVND